MLRVKLQHFSDILLERENIAKQYNEKINNKKIILPAIAPKCSHVYHLYVIQVKDRDRFREYMYDNNIKTDVHYPVPAFSALPYKYLKLTLDDFPVMSKLYDKIVSLPMYNGMAHNEIDYIIEAVNKYE